MIELTIGSRFYYRNKLVEVVEQDIDITSCKECIFFHYSKSCDSSNCDRHYRHDRKYVYFKEVNE